MVRPFYKIREKAAWGESMSDGVDSRQKWAITLLLFFFMMINFADKAIIGLAGVPIMADLELTPEQFGLVGSSFFFLFSLSTLGNKT